MKKITPELLDRIIFIFQVLSIVVTFIFVDAFLERYNIIIQAPVLIKEKFISPVPDHPLPPAKNEANVSSTEAHWVVVESPEEDITQLVKRWADRYGVDRELADCVAFRESSYNPLATGDSGRARGLFQWHLESWHFIRKKMNEPTADLRDDPDEATKTAMYAMANGYKGWWTTIKKGDCK